MLTGTNVKNQYTGTGSTATYNFTFYTFVQSDLAVTVISADGKTTYSLALTTDYTVTGAGNISGGSITLVSSGQAWLTGGNLTTNYGITIARSRPVTQTTDIRNQSTFFAQNHEDAFDHMVMVEQQLNELAARSLKIPITDTTGLTTMLGSATARANNYLVFDASGNVTATPASNGTSGLTPGSVLFAGSNGFPTQNNASFFWDTANLILKAKNLQISGTSPWADVLAYGAKGDGTTDDTTAIQNAMNAAQVVFFPPGKTFLISSALLFGDKDQILIFGAGTFITIGSTPIPVFKVPASTLTARRQYVIRNASLTANSVAGQEIIQLADAGGYGNARFEGLDASLFEKHANWVNYDQTKTRQSVVEFDHMTDTPPNLSTNYWGKTVNAFGTFAGGVKLVYTDFRNRLFERPRILNIDGDILLTRFSGDEAQPTFANGSGCNGFNAIDSFLNAHNPLDNITFANLGGWDLDNVIEKCTIRYLEIVSNFHIRIANCVLKDELHIVLNNTSSNDSIISYNTCTSNCIIYMDFYSTINPKVIGNSLYFNGSITSLISLHGTDHAMIHDNSFYGSDGTHHPVNEIAASGCDFTSIKNNTKYAAGSSVINGAHSVEASNLDDTGKISTALIGTVAGTTVLTADVLSDANQRFTLGADGTMSWGPGTAGTDTTLARSAAGALTLTGNKLLYPNGTQANPAAAFTNKTGLGLFLASASNSGILGVSLSNAGAFAFDGASYADYKFVVASIGSIGFGTGSSAADGSADTVLVRDGGVGILAQKNGNTPQTHRTYAGNGANLGIVTVNELLTIAASATTDSATTIPAGAIILAVAVRVTTVIPTAATFTVTAATGGNTFDTAAVSTAANSTDAGTAAGALYTAAGTKVRITPNLTPGAATGVVRLAIMYYLSTPPTS